MILNKTLYFLVVGENPEITETLKRIIEKTEGWSADIHRENPQIFETIKQNNYDIVLISSGLSSEFESQVASYCHNSEKDLRIIMHYGGGSGLLHSEVLMLFPELHQ